jgi:hypothetical protein
MILIIILTFLIFLSYYLSSINSLRLEYKIVFIFGFLLFGSALRVIINPELNNDYYGYFDLHNFDTPDNFLTFLFSEPYLLIIYKFFNLFTTNKQIIFLEIYWFNFIITNIFFLWLATRKDVVLWKKMIIFVFYFVLFGFVLLRNGPVYMLFAYFFYYSFRNKNYKKIIFTPFMHMSAIALVILLFHKRRNYLKILFLVILGLIPIFIFFIMPILSEVEAISRSMSKFDSYSEELESVSVFHKVGLLFTTIIVFITMFVYKKKAINPIFITTIVFYYIAYLINPIMGFRFSPYLFFSILLFDYNGSHSSTLIRKLNIISFLLFPYFIFTLFNSHTL